MPIDELFPYPNYRKGQKETIIFIKNVIESGSIGLLHAPTGIGKTISALTAYFSAFKEEGSKGFFLTRTKSQAMIYVKELRKISRKIGDIPFVIMRSKKDYCLIARQSKKIRDLPYYAFVRFCEVMRSTDRCPYYKNTYKKGKPTEALLNAELELLEIGATPENIIRVSRRYNICPYELAKFFAEKGEIIVGSYNYIFSDIVRESFLEKINIELKDAIVIVDEAHNLPDFITSAFGLYLSTATVEEAIKELERLGYEYEDYIDFLQDLLSQIRGIKLEKEDTPHVVDLSFLKFFSNKHDISFLREAGEKYVERGYGIFSRLSFIADFLDNARFLLHLDEYTTLAIRSDKHVRIGFELLDPSYAAKEIFNRAKAVVLMSGSLYPIEYYKTSLGLLGDERVRELILRSPFPEDAMKIIVDLSVTTKYTERTPFMIKRIARNLDIILDVIKDYGVLVVFPSYALMRNVLEEMKLHRRVFAEERSTEIDEVINLLRVRRNAVIFSVAGGKLMEGIDYRIGNETVIKAVVIVGIPFPEINDLLKEKEKYYTEKYGSWWGKFITIIAPAIRKILQAAGRLIRDEKDWGVCIILDWRFHRHKYWKFMPSNWKKYDISTSEEGLKNKLKAIFMRRIE